MKHSQIIVAAVLSGFIFACSNPAKESLGNYADLQNRECPQHVDGELILTDYTYSDNDNEFRIGYSVSEVGASVAEMRRSEKPLRRIISQNFRQKNLSDLLALLLDAEATLDVRFIGEITDDTLSIKFSPVELKAIADSSRMELSDFDRLEALVANENAHCPQHIAGDSLVITAMTVEAPFVVLTYSFNPEAYSFNRLDSMALRETFEPGLRRILTDGPGREQLVLMKKLGLGMCYRFIPTDTTPSFSLEIPAADIASY